VLTNEVQSTKTKEPLIVEAKKNAWERWPEAKRYDGPGMSVSIFRRLKLGDLFYNIEQKSDGRVLFRSGLHFEEMQIN
jgi:hypothetical protein